MLHAAILSSPHAHARIKSYDVTKALAAPGVKAVVTGDDCPDGLMGACIKDEHAIAKGKVRYVGEPVAAVAAETEAQARAACSMIQVEYEELAAVLTPEEALKPAAPVLHEDLGRYRKVFDTGSEGNLCSRTLYAEGDIEAAWRECDVIVEDWFETPAQAHVSLEPCGALSEIDANGRITLWSANQSVFRVQAGVCESLKLPMSRVRSLTPRIGAGFGNKTEPHVQPICVMLTVKTGRPVKLILSREEDFEMVRVRHPAKIRVKTGARSDGTLVAHEVEAILDGGAYADDSPMVLSACLRLCAGSYRFKAVKVHGVVAYTNKLRSGAFRGFGQPQVQFGVEQQIDELARRLGIDSIELRRRNTKAKGERWLGGHELRSSGLAECLAKVEAQSGWAKRAELPVSPGKRRGMGVAITSHISATLTTGAIVRMLEDGTLVLNTGAQDIGQGSDTVLTQICAEALQVSSESVALASPDTDGSPYNWGTSASRTTYMVGRSVVGACAEVERKAKEHAAELLECAVQDLELRRGGKVGVAGVPGKEISFAEISRHAHWAKGGPIIGTHSWAFDQPFVDPKRAIAVGAHSKMGGVLSFGAIVVEVEVDELSGKVEVPRVWTAVDAGRAINPMSLEGQLEGAFVQGMGFALTEKLVWDGARLANPTLMDYKVPTSRDVPYEIYPIIVESNHPDGPFGAKGAGEIGMNGVAAAIANAVTAATGVRYRRLPLTPEVVLRGMLSPRQ